MQGLRCTCYRRSRPRCATMLIGLALVALFALGGCSVDASAANGGSTPGVSITVNNGAPAGSPGAGTAAATGQPGTPSSASTSTDSNTPLELLGLITVLSLAPSIIMMVTGFTRILIVLSFLRSGLGAQQVPPNQVVIGIALFLTIFVMAPTWQQINDSALTPYQQGKISQQAALDRAQVPLRNFMFKQTREQDLSLFVSLAKMPQPRTQADVPTYVLIPSFILSEIKTAFQMGFLILLPFMVIDLIVSTSLMSVGMMMLSPTVVSLPFKLLLFVLVDGWGLVIRSLVLSFH